MPNRLARSASPYLRQHADNPVAWWEWSPDAFAEARRRDVPVFLSVGYASCHWCHVMAHESFEDEGVAATLNEGFVAIKVDREERPDVDAVYMDAVQVMTGRGGWPMSVFTDADGRPFLAGTYWPREDHHGMPGFVRVLDAVQRAWSENREGIDETAGQLVDRLRQTQAIGGTADAHVDEGVADRAAALAAQAWDRELGGFGGAPKFPAAMLLDFLLAHGLRTGSDEAITVATHSLEAMSAGGIHDLVDGGFARYSTDARWLVPHFEKMLYDNALLLRAYVHAWQVTGRERFLRTARTTADWMVGRMQQPGGGFSSSTDADTEGVEGATFVWSAAELREVVTDAGEDPDAWARRLGVTPEGNWEGTNVLHEAERLDSGGDLPAGWETVRSALSRRRAGRPQPAVDDKVLTSWNALAIAALAEASRALGEPRWLEAAQRCARFLQATLVADGALQHTWRNGHAAHVPALLEDVAGLAQALLVLAEADGDARWVAWARELAAQAEHKFADPDAPGTYFTTAHDAETLVSRPKDLWDNAQPAGPSQMVDVHLRLAALTGEAGHAELADSILAAFLPRAERAPTGYGELLRGLERRAGERLEVALVGEAAGLTALRAVWDERWRPACVLAVSADPLRDAAAIPLLEGRSPMDARAAAYVCHDFACQRPVTAPEELRALLP